MATQTKTRRSPEEQAERNQALALAEQKRTLPIRGVYWNDLKIVEGFVETNFAAGELTIGEYLTLICQLHVWDKLQSMDFERQEQKKKGRRS